MSHDTKIKNLAELTAALPSIRARVDAGEYFTIHAARLTAGQPVSYAVFNAARVHPKHGPYTARMETDGLPRSWDRALCKAVA